MTECETILKMIEEVSPDDTAKLEAWEAIPEWPVYEASSLGNIRNAFTRKLLSKSVWGGGYYRVKLSRKGISKEFKVCALVASAFIGPRPEGMTIDHLDGNKQKDTPDNLEYVTQRENVARLHRRAKGDNLGVFYDENTNRYNAQISVGQKKITLGWYPTNEEAVAAYKAAFKMTEAFDVRSK